MTHSHSRTIRNAGIAGWGLLVVLAGTRVQAEPARPQSGADARACQAAYQNGRDREQSGRLVEASQLYAKCSDEACGAPLWQDCMVHSTQLSTAVPSVVPIVVDESGAPRIDVKVEMDGRIIASQLNGRSISIDPGTHDFSFSTPAGVFASRRLTIVKGERNRALAISLPSDGKSRPSASKK